MEAKEMKYVVIEGDWGLKNVILFPANINHSKFKDLNPISAGFCKLCDDDAKVSVKVYGKSDSLDLSPNPEDPDIIKMMIYTQTPWEIE